MLKNFSKDQLRIRSEWRNKVAKSKEVDEKSLNEQFAALEDMMRRAFG